MLFDVEPKWKREYLYDFREELEIVEKALNSSKVTVVSGLRRTGKTSLMKVALNEVGLPHLYLDPRLSLNSNYRDFAELMRDSLQDFLRRHSSLAGELRETISRLRGFRISLNPLQVEVKWRSEGKVTL